MVDLIFSVEGVEVQRHAIAPALLFKLRVANRTPDLCVQNILLQCQIRIDATRRRYTPDEQEMLGELFGEKHRWSETARSLLWTHAAIQIPALDDEYVVDLPVPCTFDFNVAATKYFHGLMGHEVPLTFLFSGTVFYRDAEDLLQMDQISWSQDSTYRLPVSVWQSLMDLYYPNSTWLRIDRGTFDQIYAFKRRNGFTTWEETLQALLSPQHEESLP